MSDRILRVNQLLKREVSQLLLKEVDLPQNILATVTRAETAVNLSEAKIYVSVIPEKEKKRVLYVLERKIYHLQQKLNKKLQMRPMPKIRFLAEKGTEQAGRIEKILAELKSKR
jgi:ribosome-binding factor A